MTAASAEKSDTMAATVDEAAKATAAGEEEAQSQDGDQGQGRDQNDCEGPYICDCRLWYVACAVCCFTISSSHAPLFGPSYATPSTQAVRSHLKRSTTDELVNCDSICGRAVEFPGEMCFECSKTH